MKNEKKRLKCGCIPDASGYGYCDECQRALNTKIWKRLTPEQKAYDRLFGGAETAQIERDADDSEL